MDFTINASHLLAFCFRKLHQLWNKMSDVAMDYGSKTLKEKKRIVFITKKIRGFDYHLVQKNVQCSVIMTIDYPTVSRYISHCRSHIISLSLSPPPSLSLPLSLSLSLSLNQLSCFVNYQLSTKNYLNPCCLDHCFMLSLHQH